MLLWSKIYQTSFHSDLCNMFCIKNLKNDDKWLNIVCFWLKSTLFDEKLSILAFSSYIFDKIMSSTYFLDIFDPSNIKLLLLFCFLFGKKLLKRIEILPQSRQFCLGLDIFLKFMTKNALSLTKYGS